MGISGNCGRRRPDMNKSQKVFQYPLNFSAIVFYQKALDELSVGYLEVVVFVAAMLNLFLGSTNGADLLWLLLLPPVTCA